MLLTDNVFHCLTDVSVIRSQLFIPLILRNHVGILYLKSMMLCIFSTYILAKLGQPAAKTMIFKTAMCRSSILLSRLLSLMEEASY